ncbi:MAG: hypothetical protein V7K40_07520 [Nostoc sp.]|uniref:hypothetical protein n=1 Tax=Nostoc sp. TaxID=1180 RepID=UPI002FF8F159
MSKQSNEKSVILPKDVFVLNTLAMGVAIQILAKITGEEIEEWKKYVNVTASEQYRQLSSQQIQEIVNTIKDL